MSGELTLSQFRYTTTNNRDFVIGDPSDSVGLFQPKYLVFQTSTIAGYTANPYIGVFYNTGTSSWDFQISRDGTTVSSFADINQTNIFNATTTFAATTVFNSLVTFNAGFFVAGGTPTFSAGALFQGSSTIFGQPNVAAVVDGNLYIHGDFHVTGTASYTTVNQSVSASNTLILNDATGGGTPGTILTAQVGGGAGFIVWSGGSYEGAPATGSALTSLLVTSSNSTTSPLDTLTFTPYNVGTSGLGFPMSFKGAGLTSGRTYTYPNANGTVVLDTTISALLPSVSGTTLTGAVTGSGTGTIATSLNSLQTAIISWTGPQTITNATVSTDTAHGALVVYGGIASGNNINALGTVTGSVLVARATTGTAPLTIYSTTAVPNLTASYINMTTSSLNSAFSLVYTSATNTLNSGSAITYNPSTGAVNITGSLNITGAITAGSGLSGGGGGSVPSGSIMPFAGTVLPTGWLWCNGDIQNDGTGGTTNTYPSLFAAIGYTYGGNALVHYYVIPDLRNRFIYGTTKEPFLSGIPGVSPTLGITGGEETHVLSLNEMPAHTHAVQSYAGTGSTGNHINSPVYPTGSGSFTGSTGSGLAHNNMPPYIMLNYIIKT